MLPAALDPAGTALFGRTAELVHLAEVWEVARHGHGGLVSVVGVEGVGKTRLVAELAITAHQQRAVVAYARCDASHRSARALFDQVLRSAGSSLMRAEAGAIPGESLGASIARRLDEWSTDAPVLVVLDDLHEADAEVLEVVAEVSATASEAAVLVLAVFRTERGDVPRPAPSDQQVLLEPVDRIAVAAICELYGDDWSAADIDRLFEESRGIPLAVHEEATSWIREAATRRVDEAAGQAQLAEFRLTSSQQAVADEVVGLQRVVEQRRRQLGNRHVGPAPVVCPFKGLAHFEREDAPWFFGRERIVAEIAAHLVTRPVIAVVGASGSGKSSLVRAGLLPALAEGALPGSESWRVVVTGPGAVADRGPGPAAGRDRRRRRRRRVRLLVVIDQMEELFTLCDDPLEREAFAQMLDGVVRDGWRGHHRRAGRPDRLRERGSDPRAPRQRERRARRTDPGARAPRRRRTPGATRGAAARRRLGRGDPR